MRRTYAHNAVVIGVLLGFLVAIKAGIILGIIVAVAVSIIGYKLIRAFENKVDDVADRAGDAISHAIYDKKKKKDGEDGSQDLADRYK